MTPKQETERRLSRTMMTLAETPGWTIEVRPYGYGATQFIATPPNMTERVYCTVDFDRVVLTSGVASRVRPVRVIANNLAGKIIDQADREAKATAERAARQVKVDAEHDARKAAFFEVVDAELVARVNSPLGMGHRQIGLVMPEEDGHCHLRLDHLTRAQLYAILTACDGLGLIPLPAPAADGGEEVA